MVESNRNNEPRALTKEFIEKVDALTRSPNARASFIWTELARTNSKITNWDLVCFCVEVLGLMSSEFPWLREAAIASSKLVYKAHYLNQDRIITSEHEISLDDKGMNIPRMTGG
ncbi:hypothetical protein LCGC14_2189070 [marine sediment metagenome]|uniref:Uncharacterized protein n=1 Tax=marine sediment metagenome TaxID=412755 RepID=A0A0F9GFX8_9ZZZZ